MPAEQETVERTEAEPGRDATTRAAPDRELVVQNPEGYPEAEARRIVAWLAPLLAHEVPTAASLTLRMVGDHEMQHLNATYAGRDEPTDVLSFPGELEALAGGATAPGPGHLGDIVISIPTARRQAAARGHSVEHELRVLILHGILHCMGYDHTTDNGTMEQLEARLRARWIDHG